MIEPLELGEDGVEEAAGRPEVVVRGLHALARGQPPQELEARLLVHADLRVPVHVVRRAVRGARPGLRDRRAPVPELWDAVEAHRSHAESSGQLAARRSARAAEELRQIVAQRLLQRARQICTGAQWDALTGDVAEHRADPWSAADELLAEQ